MIAFNQLPLVDELLNLMNDSFGQLMTIQGDIEGDLNRYKEEYRASIQRLLRRSDVLWRKINAMAEDASPQVIMRDEDHSAIADEPEVWEEDDDEDNEDGPPEPAQ